MGDGEVFLSTREADRVAVIREVVERRLPQSEAARRLGLGVRQVKRLVRRFRERGAAGLASSRRGKPPNNAIDAAVRRAVLDLVRERYEDFGPTFACEKLAEEHGHRVSAETLRGWMIEDGLWESKPRRAIREHPSRPAAGVSGRPGADRRFAARLVRGPGAVVHADRVRGRRDVAAAGGGLLRGGDDRGVHADDARAPGLARPAGGVLLGPLRGVPGEPA